MSIILKSELVPVVLAGGQGRRMGSTEKGLINIHGTPQYKYLVDLLSYTFNEVFISIREEQSAYYEVTEKAFFVYDRYSDCGPMGAIVSCLESTGKSVLAIACDMPHITEKAIRDLIKIRDISKLGTAYILKPSHQIQPLFAIYEYQALEFLKKLKSQKKFSLSKNMDKYLFNLVASEDELLFFNINKPEDLKNFNL